MGGAPLATIERTLRASALRASDPCRAARNFATRAVHDLAYLAGVVRQVRRGRLDQMAVAWEAVVVPEMPVALGVLGACVREGVDSPEKLAVHLRRHPYASRVGSHAGYEAIRARVRPGPTGEAFTETRSWWRCRVEAVP